MKSFETFLAEQNRRDAAPSELHRWEEEFVTLHRAEFELFIRNRDNREFCQSRMVEFEKFWVPLDHHEEDRPPGDRIGALRFVLEKIPQSELLKKTRVVDKATLDLLNWWRVTPPQQRPLHFTLGQLPSVFTVVSSNALGRALARLFFVRKLVAASKGQAAYWVYSPTDEARAVPHDPNVIWPPEDV